MPQDSQTKHEPAGRIRTPQVEQYGASTAAMPGVKAGAWAATGPEDAPADPAGAAGRCWSSTGTGAGAGPAAPVAASTPAPQAPAFTPGMAAVDAPYCSTCGVRMRPAGSCFVCESCGTTSGCS